MNTHSTTRQANEARAALALSWDYYAPTAPLLLPDPPPPAYFAYIPV